MLLTGGTWRSEQSNQLGRKGRDLLHEIKKSGRRKTEARFEV